MADGEDKVLFARSSEACLLGKCTAELRFRVPEDTEALLLAKSRAAGFATLAEYLRMKALIDAHGLDTIQKIQQDRLNFIAGIGKESAQ